MHLFFLFLLLVISVGNSAEEPLKKRVCLNMIVKNESHVITRCLSSVRPIIDCWVIVDTGSTDGTREIIRQYLKDLPGELYERPWVNFEHNREEALQLAKKSEKAAADYILFIDADDYFTYDPEFKLPDLKQDFYLIRSDSNGTDYYLPRLIKSSLNWHWHGVLHEYVSALDAKFGERLPGVQNVYTSEGARSRDPEKYKKDVAILEEALKKEPNNARYMFYLARSYACTGNCEKAIENFEKRVKMGGWGEEVFYSLLQIARLQDRLEFDGAKVEDNYLKAYVYRPVRIEPLFYLVNKFRVDEEYRKGYEMAKIALLTKLPNDNLFVEKWIYDYGLLFEYSICAYYVGQYEESLKACDRLLAMKDLPESYRKFTLQNRVFAEEKVQQTAMMQKIHELFPNFEQKSISYP